MHNLPSEVTSRVPSAEEVSKVYTDLICDGRVHVSATSKKNDPLTREQVERRLLKFFNDLAKEKEDEAESGWTLKKWYSKWSPPKSDDAWPTDDNQCKTLANMLTDLVMDKWKQRLRDAASAAAPLPGTKGEDKAGAPSPPPKAQKTKSPEKEDLYDCQCTRAIQPVWISKKCSRAECDKECQVCWEHALARWEGLCLSCRK